MKRTKNIKKYMKEREKIWQSIKIKKETLFALKSLEAELEVHTYDDAIKYLLKLAKH